MLQSGMHQNVELPSSFMTVTKTSSMQAKKAMQEGWAFDKDVIRDHGQRFSQSKVSRCQLGVELHKVWQQDLAKTCCKNVMLVNDFHHGSGEVFKACMDTKVGDEASAQGVRLCAWSHNPRTVFHEAGRARGRTHVGNQYMKRKLTLAGHQPVDDPGA